MRLSRVDFAAQPDISKREVLRIRTPGGGNRTLFPNRAVRAIAADDPVNLDLFDEVAISEIRNHTAIASCKTDKFGAPLDLNAEGR
jgi:hypothetical protein